jgi:hypothetical protein
MKCDLVKKFAICKEKKTKGRIMMPCLRWWWVRWQSISMCLIRSWKIELWAIWKELWLSHYIRVGWERETLISASNQHNQTIYLVVDAITQYSASVEDWEIIDRFLLFQEIRESPRDTKTSNRLAICGITIMISIIVCT